MGRHHREGPPEYPEADTYFDQLLQHYLSARQAANNNILHVASKRDHVTGLGLGVVIFSLPDRFPGDEPDIFMDIVESHGYMDEDVTVVEAQPVDWMEPLPDGFVAVGLPRTNPYMLPSFMVFLAPREN